MARSIEARLAALRGDPKAADVTEALRAKVGLLVAAAVPHASALGLLDELVPAFERLTEDPVKRDPTCRGKITIARTLHDLDRWEDGVFARGVTFVQLEPAFGGPVDTAPELRGVCGLAHAHFARSDALDVLAKLLTDREPVPRIAAAQGLGDAGRVDASALLRYKILVGDDEPNVLAACFESLRSLTGDHARDFIASFLAQHDDRAELAVLALGASRADDVLPLIVAWCEGCLPEQRGRVGYLALALMRRDDATAHLLDVIRSGAPRDAIAAYRALATFKDDPAVRVQLAEAASAQPDRAARAELAKLAK
jgi:hypothetical protein